MHCFAFTLLSILCWANPSKCLQIDRDVSSRELQSSGAHTSFLFVDGEVGTEVKSRRLSEKWLAAHGQWIRDLRGSLRPSILHIHIPKTAGTSFALDMNRSLLDYSIFSAEQSITQINIHFHKKPSDVSVALLRDPRSHVYALFLECADSLWGQRATRFRRSYFNPVNSSRITPWLRHFTDGEFTNATKESFGCYHPLNLQTRFVGSGKKQWHNTPRFAESNKSLFLAAKSHLRHDVEIVGTVERYQESLCLLHVRVTDTLPDWCNCSNRTAWASFKSVGLTQQEITAHGVRPHSLEDLSEKDLRMIDALTEDDQKLYAIAEARLADDLGKVWQKHGVPVWCD